MTDRWSDKEQAHVGTGTLYTHKIKGTFAESCGIGNGKTGDDTTTVRFCLNSGSDRSCIKGKWVQTAILWLPPGVTVDLGIEEDTLPLRIGDRKRNAEKQSEKRLHDTKL